MTQNKLIAIVGPTGSGKTALSISLAKLFDGEIINADSRAIYRELDIATAKPSIEERQGIKHHLIDIASPDEVYTAAQYQVAAQNITSEVQARGKLPIMVGGTGLYFDCVINNYHFPQVSDLGLRAKLSKLTLPELVGELDKLDKDALNAVDRRNKRRVVRALEVIKLTGEKFSLQKVKEKSIYDTLWLGIEYPWLELRERLEGRAQAMLDAGVLEETREVVGKYGLDLPAMTSIGYPIWWRLMQGEINTDEAKDLFCKADYRLAKRQMTWFARNRLIHWLAPAQAKQQAKQLVNTFIGLNG